VSAIWQPEHPAGHAPYCAHPAHSLAVYCAADPAEPATLAGQPSRAWHRDHPGRMHPGECYAGCAHDPGDGHSAGGYARNH
jgi:hypothetical protein